MSINIEGLTLVKEINLSDVIKNEKTGILIQETGCIEIVERIKPALENLYSTILMKNNIDIVKRISMESNDTEILLVDIDGCKVTLIHKNQ